MRKRVIKLIILFFSLLIFCGCASKSKITYVPLPYSKRALSYYYYIRFLESEKQNDSKAIEFLKKAISYNPHPELFLEAGRFYFKKKKLKKAEDFIKKGLQKFPGERRLTFFLYRIYILKNQKENALALLKAYLKKHSEDDEALKNIALLYFEEKKYKKCLDVLKKVPKKNAFIHYFLAQCYIKLKNSDLAIFHLKKAVELKNDFIRAWAELGYQLELMNDYAGAEQAYYELYKRGIKNDEIRLKLIELNLKLNNPEKAFSVVEESQKFPSFLFKAALIFVHENFYTYGDKILKFLSPPYSPEILYLKGYVAFKRFNDYKKAISYLKKIPKDAPIYKDGLLFMGKLYLTMKDTKKAYEIAKEGQDRFSDPDFWLLESEILEFKKDYKKAITVIDGALKKFPKNVDLLYQKGVLLYKLKKKKEAIDIMESILEIKPDYPDALNFIGYTLAEMGKDLDKAFELIKKALKIEPNNGYYLDSLAWVYFKKGEFEKAWELIKKAVEMVKDDPIIWEHYGDIAYKLKKMAEARKGYTKALKCKPENLKILHKKLKRVKSD